MISTLLNSLGELINKAYPVLDKQEIKASLTRVLGELLRKRRPGWDEIWMGCAYSMAKRSYDPRYQVGAVVVAEDNTQVLAIGYNGNYAGGPNEAESAIPGESGMIHAEINALLKMDYNNPKRKKLYVTMSPCKMCAKSIVNAGIDEVVYAEKYRDPTGIEILHKTGIIVRHVAV